MWGCLLSDITFSFQINLTLLMRRKTRSSGSIKIPKVQTPKEQPAHDRQCERYEFVNKNYSNYLNCPLCKTLMRNPIRLHPCGHTFCSHCAPSKGKCPNCSNKITVAQKDLVGQGLVNEMTVRCLNEGCPYKGTYEEYKKYHQNTCTLAKGFDEWLKSMKGALDQHKHERQKSSSDHGRYQSEQEQKSNPKSMEFRRPKSPQRVYDFEQELLQKTLKAEL